jgi:hypothetical protein
LYESSQEPFCATTTVLSPSLRRGDLPRCRRVLASQMEEFADERCSVIYVRSDLEAHSSKLYTPSTTSSVVAHTPVSTSPHNLIQQNVRILLDEHVGDFSEGEQSSCNPMRTSLSHQLNCYSVRQLTTRPLPGSHQRSGARKTCRGHSRSWLRSTKPGLNRWIITITSQAHRPLLVCESCAKSPTISLGHAWYSI